MVAPPVHIFFDVDHTLIDTHNGLRPGVRELFERLVADGHAIYLWSGLGPRHEVIEQHRLGAFVSGCFDKPLLQYERMMAACGASPCAPTSSSTTIPTW